MDFEIDVGKDFVVFLVTNRTIWVSDSSGCRLFAFGHDAISTENVLAVRNLRIRSYTTTNATQTAIEHLLLVKRP